MNDRSAQRQALANEIRQGHLARARRRRLVTSVVVIVAALAAVAVVAWLQFRPDDEPAQVSVPEHATDDYGFTLTPELANATTPHAEPVEVKVFEDFLCPSCKVFHEQSSAFLAEQVAAGEISVTYHPFAFLLEASTDEYAQRAANAAVCVADDAGVVAYAAMHDLLLEHQPAEGGPGLSDDELIDLAGQAGASDIADCVADRRFTPWVEEALEAGRAADVGTTPTIRVGGSNVVRSEDGAESIPGPEELRVAIEAAR